MEDQQAKKILDSPLVGTCNIEGCAGSVENPYLYYALDRGVLRLREMDAGHGPITFGGNILHPVYRGIHFYPFSKFLSYARCWLLLRYPWAFHWPIFSEILPIKSDPPERQNSFWTKFGEAAIGKTYEQATKNVHFLTAQLKANMPQTIPLQTLTGQAGVDFYLARPGSRPAKRNLERIGFWEGNRFYVVDLGIIIEATVGTLAFTDAGMESGYARTHEGNNGIMVGMIGTTKPETGEVRIVLSPYSSIPGDPGYIFMPKEALKRLELQDPDKDKVHALPIPLTIFESFFGQRRET
jgi:hypothetical protein